MRNQTLRLMAEVFIGKVSTRLKKVKKIDKIDNINRKLRVIIIYNVFVIIISVKTITYDMT